MSLAEQLDNVIVELAVRLPMDVFEQSEVQDLLNSLEVIEDKIAQMEAA